jgi:hypothetical protein
MILPDRTTRWRAEERISREKRWRMTMHPTQATQSVTISVGNTRERWLTVSLLAGSLALLAWSIVAL